ncbi:serine protease easter-like [Malaya genurostris]|uniref:serine protease easter-like n=1 Tax=Malaya genurostris TaxID=325434 RepID=UPI0026F3BC07|nr:serine protease easter-like [Malaya genurostris]
MVNNGIVLVLTAVVVLLAAGGCLAQDDKYQCGIPRVRTQFLIVRGEDARHGHWPWHVALWVRQKDGTEKYACGGTLISHKFVLTAAHCVLSENRHQLLRSAKDITIWAGVFNIRNPEQDTRQVRSVARIHIDGYTRDNLLHDIALLELTEPVTYSAYVLPACLNSKPNLRTDIGSVVGWGVADDDKPSPTLKKLSLPVVAESECLKSDPLIFGVALQKELFCAGYANGSAPCNGDSGGGLMLQRGDAWYLAGIVSFTKIRGSGSDLCLADSYTAFTNVTAYWDWIERVTNIDFRGKYNEERDIPCTTPKGAPGTCVPLQQCMNIFNVIRAPLIAEEDAYLINRSVCTIAGIPRAVCCRKDQIEPVPLHPNALLLPSDCGRSKVRTYPGRGQSTSVFEFPWMAMVRFQMKKNGVIPFCLGTLLNTRYVLSVAGCMAKLKTVKVDHVRLGEHTESTDIDCSFDAQGRRLCADYVLDVKIESIIAHPQFDVPMYTNDLAIVRMAVDIQYTDHIRPVCLPINSPYRTTVPNDLLVTAWDMDIMAKNIYKGELRRYPHRRVDIDTCQRGLESIGFAPALTEDRMCPLQLGPEYNCQRMAGAPIGAYVDMDGERFVQFGLWKFAPLNCTVRETVPGLAMNLIRYLDWILDNIKPSDSSIIKNS